MRLGASKTSLSHLSWSILEAPRAVLEPWRRLGRAGGGPGSVLGGLGAILAAYKMRLGGSLGRLGAVLRALEAMLEPSGTQKAPKIEPKRVPNRAPEATRTENCKTLIFNHSTKDFNGFSCLRGPLGRQKWVQNGFQIASSMLKASERLLTGILAALGRSPAAPYRLRGTIPGPRGRLTKRRPAASNQFGGRAPPPKHLS